MATDNKEPEGLDEFISSSEPHENIGQVVMQNPNVTDKVNRSINVNSTMQQYYNAANAAAHGDPNAELAQAQQTAKVAMRTVPALDDGGEIPAGVDQFIGSQDGGPPSPASNEPAGLDEFIAPELKEAKYGTPWEMAKTAAEGVAQGATFGVSTGLETALGVNPEDIRARAEVNPVTHIAGQVGGAAATALIPGVGEAGIIGDLGEAAAAATGLGREGAGFLSQVARDTVKGAFEGALFQGGEEIHKAFTQDPNQTAESAIADIGLAGILSGAAVAPISAGLRALKGAVMPEAERLAPTFVSEVDRPAIEAGDLKTTIENSNILNGLQKERILGGLSEEKPNAKEIRSAAERLGAPVMEGMTSDSKWVQRAEDSLVNGAPTYSGIKRANLYNEGYKVAANAVDEAIGAEGRYTKAELGNILKDSIGSQIKEESAPITAMYNYIKQFHDIIPVNKAAIEDITNDLKGLQELRLSPSSPGAATAKAVINEIGGLKTVDDIKAYRSLLFDRVAPTAPPAEKRAVSIIADKLKSLENNSVETFAKQIPANDETKTLIQSLIEQRKAADAAYKPFVKKLQTLSEQLGKGRVHGAQDAINFLQNLTPEEVTQKLFSKKDSEFLKFFKKEFPEQMQLMQEYQKGALREAASRTGELSPKVLFNNINKLEPEIQKAIFNPAELQKLKDAELYLRSFPKNFNPSGTSGASAFRAFFEHPTGALIANVRDLGIEKFIKAVSVAPEVQQATKLAKATVSGYKTADKAIKSIFNPDKTTMPVALTVSGASRDKIKKLVEEYTENPQKMTTLNANNPIPEYNQAFAATSTRAVQYLAAIKPNTTPASPLDPKPVISPIRESAYNRAIDIAQQPLIVLKHIQDGQLTSQDITTLHTIYPNLYNQLNRQLSTKLMNHVTDGKSVPYKQRVGISLFLGQPMDSTMKPMSIVAAQPMPQMPQQASPGAPAKHSTAKLSKMPGMYQTPGQAAESRRAVKD